MKENGKKKSQSEGWKRRYMSKNIKSLSRVNPLFRNNCTKWIIHMKYGTE